MSVNLQALQQSGKKGLNLSLLKFGPITQAALAIIITTIVLVATAATVTVVTTRSQFQAPIANNDEESVYKNKAVNIFVLANDKDPRRANLTVTSVQQPQYGKAEVVDNRYIKYYAPPRYAGDVSFKYTCSNSKLSASASVLVHVKNHKPEPVDFRFKVNKNSKGNKKNLLKEEGILGTKITDVDSEDLLKISGVTQPKNGKAWFDEENVYYTPNQDFNNVDKLSYNVTDDNATVSGSISFTVINNPPIANPDHFEVKMNTKGVLDVLANDVDINNDKLTIVSVGYKGPSTVRINEQQDKIEYLPERGLTGFTDSFEYTITDGSEYSSTFVTVKLVNNPPVAGDYTATIGKNTKNYPVPLKYSDPNPGTTLTITIPEEQKKKLKGKVNLKVNEQTKSFVYLGDMYVDYKWNDYSLFYDAKTGSVYDETIEYIVSDGQLETKGTIKLSVVNSPPTAKDDHPKETCAKRKSLVIDVLPNDSDVNGDEITLVQSFESKEGGTTEIVNGKIQYDAPSNGFTGEDSFEYEIADVQENPKDSLKDKATVYVKVVNSAPVAKDDSYTLSKGLTKNLPVLNNDYDPNYDVIDIKEVGETKSGATVNIKKVKNSQGQLVSHIEYQALNEIYEDSFEYTITDGEDEAKATVSISVKNDAPVANDDEISIHWNTETRINVLENDEDKNPEDKNELEVASISSSTNGATITNAKKSIKYKPKDKFVGDDTFTYTAKDLYDTSNEATVTVHVTNNAPVARDDEVTYHWNDGKQTIKVLSNDEDPDSDAITITEPLTVPSDFKGTVAISTDKKSIEFTPSTTSPVSIGTQSFEYTITDGVDTSKAKVTITITNKDKPAKNDRSFTYHWRTPSIQFNVFSSVPAKDNDGDTLSLSINSNPSSGSAETVDGKDIKYTQENNQVKSDSFTFDVSDGVNTATSTASITITNQAPTAENFKVYLPYEDISTGANVDVLAKASDSDPEDEDKLSIVSIGTPSHGNATKQTVDEKTIINYKPNADWKGEDTFSYTITDGLATTQASITVETLSAELEPKIKSYTIHWSTQSTGSEWDVISDIGSDFELSSITQEPTHGTAKIESDDESGKKIFISYKQNEGYVGQDVVKAEYVNPQGESDIVTVYITIINSDPVASSKSASIHWTKTANIDLLDGASDSDSQDTPSIKSVGNPSHGIAELLDDKRTVRYTPNKPYIGKDSFKFIVTDGLANDEKTVRIDVNNQAPVAVDDSYTKDYTTNSYTLDVLANDKDDDDEDNLTIKKVSSTKSGATVTIENNKVTYTPKSDFIGKDTFTYVITDGAEESSQAKVSVTINAPTPSVESFTKTIPWTSTASFSLLSGSTGVEIKVDSVESAQYGTIDWKANGDLTYDPDSSIDYPTTTNRKKEVSETLTFKATDKFGRSTSGNITVTIWNNKPIAQDDSDTFARTASNPDKYYSVLENDSDDEDLSIKGPLDYNGEGTASISNGQKIRYKPKEGFVGTETVKYRATDGQLVSDWATLTITVTNEAPNCNNVTKPTVKGSSYTWDLIKDAKCTDSNGDSLTLSVKNPPSDKGIITVENNRLKYTQKQRRSGTYSFKFYVSDGDKEIERTCTITTPNNRPKAKFLQFTYEKKPDSKHIIDAAKHGSDEDTGDIVSLKDFDFTGIDNCLNDPNVGGSISMSNGKLVYEPKNTFHGTCSVYYTIKDGDVDNEKTDRSVITITVQNQLPVARDDEFTTSQGTDAVIPISSLLKNDYDPDGEEVEFDGLVDSSCDQEGWCHRKPSVQGNSIVWPSDPKHCDTDRIRYRIRTKGDSGSTDEATIFLKFKDCTCFNPIDVMYVIDGSGSIKGNSWDKLVSFTGKITQKFQVGEDLVNIGIVQYSHYARVEIDLGYDKNKILRKIKNMKQLKSTTGTIFGLEKGIERLKAKGRDGIPKIIVVITDGIANRPYKCGNGRYPGNYGSKYGAKTCYGFYKNILGRNTWKNDCKSPNRYPGKTCYNCRNFPYAPCSDPLKITDKIKTWTKKNGKDEDWKVVSLGIGKGLDYYHKAGWKQVKEMNHDPKNAFKVEWSNLDNIVNEIVDNTCDRNNNGGNENNGGTNTKFEKKDPSDVEWEVEHEECNYDTDDDQTTCSYKVIANEPGKDLSHWVIGIPEFLKDSLVDTDPSGGKVGLDPTTNVYGIKFDEPQKSGTTETYKIIFNGNFETGEVSYSVKGGTYYAVGSTIGPLSKK